MKKIYMRNVLLELWKRKIPVFLCIVLCVGIGSYLGLKKYKAGVSLTEAEQEEINTYNERLLQYDKVIADVEESYRLADEQVQKLQKYIDESIYMSLDPEKVYVGNVQFSVTAAADGVSAGNVLNAINLFITQGGGKDELDDADKDLKAEYWGEVLTASISGNTYSVNIMQPDEEKAERTIKVIYDRIMKEVPALTEKHGAFNISDPEFTVYEKSEASIVNTQNNNLNNLKSFTGNRADQENKKISNQNAKDNYMENQRPEALDKVLVYSKKTIIKYGIVGFVAGIIIPMLIILLYFMFSNKISGSNSMKSVLGVYKNGAHEPEIGRVCMDARLINEGTAPVVVDIAKDTLSEKICAGLTEKLGTAVCSLSTEEGMNEALGAGGAMMVVEAGRTTYTELEEAISLCEKYSIKYVGSVVIE